MPKLVAHLIDHCHELFGASITTLFGSNKDLEKQDSDVEEDSDTFSSLPENTRHLMRGKRDVFIESYDRMMGKDSPTSMTSSSGSPCKRLSSPVENKTSLSNLSQDSGLTLSDTQLYNPDDADSESSENYVPQPVSRLPLHLTKSVPKLDASSYEDAINMTFSYGRSVGISIDGSCYDVVRRRRHHDSLVLARANQLSKYLSNNSRYRHRRPPLAAVLLVCSLGQESYV